MTGRPPDASHCNNIGAAHRKLIHAALEKWFGIRANDITPALFAELADETEFVALNHPRRVGNEARFRRVA